MLDMSKEAERNQTNCCGCTTIETVS